MQLLLYLICNCHCITYLCPMIDQNKLRTKARSKIVGQQDLVIAINQLGYKMDAPRFSRWLSGEDESEKKALQIKEAIKTL